MRRFFVLDSVDVVGGLAAVDHFQLSSRGIVNVDDLFGWNGLRQVQQVIGDPCCTRDALAVVGRHVSVGIITETPGTGLEAYRPVFADLSVT